jgi:hypothetical protein
MRTLVYKRTHNGDPDTAGRFGCNGCMGSVRSWDFDAVIGVGGVGREPKLWGIAGKVNWIGIGPHKTPVHDPIVTFDHFLDFGTGGPELRDLAPFLAELMYDRGARVAMNLNPHEQSEVDLLLALATDEPPSPALATTVKQHRRKRCRANRC